MCEPDDCPQDPMDAFNDLITEYEMFTKQNNLPYLSADELLVELTIKEDRRFHDYLNNFIKRWDEVAGEI